MDLKEIRESKTGLNQKQFAKLIDVPYTTYRNYEKQVRQVPIDVLLKISNKTNTAIGEILEQQSSEEKNVSLELKQIIELVKKVHPEDLKKVYGYLLGLIDARS